ncbi:hypothetical protein, partial [Candidatus Magnetobacterium casense]
SLSSIKPAITLPATQAELGTIADAKAKGLCVGAMKSYYTIKVYNVGTADGQKIKVEALDVKGARAKAEAAGYKVSSITRSFGLPTRTPTRQTTSATTAPTGTIRVKDGKTGDILNIPRAGWDPWPDKYKNLVTTEGFDAAIASFRTDYRELGDGQWMPRADFNSLPDQYAAIAVSRGYTAMREAFEADHIQLGDGQWITTRDWDALVANDATNGTTCAKVGKEQGYTAMVSAIDTANEPYEEFQRKVESGDIIPVPGNEYITKEEFNRLPSGSQKILKEQGFNALTEATIVRWEKGVKPRGFSWDPGYQRRLAAWNSLPQAVTNLNEVPFSYRDFYHLSESSYGRVGLLALASFVPPAKAALPEYTMADVTALDWGIAAAQAPLLILGFAPAAITSSVAGRAVTVAGSTALAGLIGYGTAKSWSALSPGQRVMGVGMTALSAVPLLTTVARNVKISGPSIPTTEGNVVAWRGLSVAGNPIIGRSGGKWVLGSRGITLPEARLILNGYKPETMLETKVFVNRSALEKAGFTGTQIEYLTKTLKDRNLFAGKMSPWLDKDVLIEPTERLNANEIGTVMQRLVKLEEGFIKKSKIKDAFLLYGSSTIKSQSCTPRQFLSSGANWDLIVELPYSKKASLILDFLI